MAIGQEKQKKQKLKSSKSASSAERDAKAPEETHANSEVPLKLQQQCLDIFRDAFKPSADDTALLQEVKGHLFKRDFGTAFGKEAYLRVYASRWSPSRALAYLDVFARIQQYLTGSKDTHGRSAISVLCLGGGAGGEFIALAGWQRFKKDGAPEADTPTLNVALADIADWSRIVNVLHEAIVTPPQLSKYASQTKKDANRAMLSGDELSVCFQQLDVLDVLDTGQAAKDCLDQIMNVELITFMFTLNELYSMSMGRTQELLARITRSAHPGTLLLVVDSPGSYSTISLSGREKKYPMHWLLDHTLLASVNGTSDSANAKWEKLINDASRWFRLPPGLSYPIDLENMRYQIHLYRRLSGTE